MTGLEFITPSPFFQYSDSNIPIFTWWHSCCSPFYTIENSRSGKANDALSVRCFRFHVRRPYGKSRGGEMQACLFDRNRTRFIRYQEPGSASAGYENGMRMIVPRGSGKSSRCRGGFFTCLSSGTKTWMQRLPRRRHITNRCCSISARLRIEAHAFGWKPNLIRTMRPRHLFTRISCRRRQI